MYQLPFQDCWMYLVQCTFDLSWNAYWNIHFQTAFQVELIMYFQYVFQQSLICKLKLPLSVWLSAASEIISKPGWFTSLYLLMTIILLHLSSHIYHHLLMSIIFSHPLYSSHIHHHLLIFIIFSHPLSSSQVRHFLTSIDPLCRQRHFMRSLPIPKWPRHIHRNRRVRTAGLGHRQRAAHTGGQSWTRNVIQEDRGSPRTSGADRAGHHRDDGRYKEIG